MFGLFDETKRKLKKYTKRVNIINKYDHSHLTDDQIKKEITKAKNIEHSFSYIKEACKRTMNMQYFDVQLIGALILSHNDIAEMKTGEGKTLTITLPVIYKLINEGIHQVHVVTVNSYLAERDANLMRPLYEFFNLKVGIINENTEDTKKEEYDSHVIYADNTLLGFDYLRDNTAISTDDILQKYHEFAIIDEVDSILIDESKTPLILSQNDQMDLEIYQKIFDVAKSLEIGERTEDTNKFQKEITTTGDFYIEIENKSLHLTEDGMENAEKRLGMGNLYTEDSGYISGLMIQALKALHTYKHKVDYIVEDNTVKIIDESTGRISEGKRWSDGLHQFIEIKEKVEIKPESSTLASITYQNLFRGYDTLSGLSGTAKTEEVEFLHTYKMNVIEVPTNVPITRIDNPDKVYISLEEKYESMIETVKEKNKLGQPILIGTTSVEKSNFIHNLLIKENIKHTILNAENHFKEAEIILNAGNVGSITVATNMAGRGVDIKLTEEAKNLGGLYIIGTERYDNRRIDNQLRGRSGRQGDAGETQFLLSLEDDLLKTLGIDKVKGMMTMLNLERGTPIQSKIVTRAIEKSQKKIESMSFEYRKHTLDYDNVYNEQRKLFFKLRKDIIYDRIDIFEKLQENLLDILSELVSNAHADNKTISNEFDKIFKIQINNLELLNNKSDEEIVDYLKDLVYRVFQMKNKNIPKENITFIFKTGYLQIIDILWRMHINKLELLQKGINLRSNNNKDPLTEFQKESYMDFLELRKLIKSETVKELLGIELNQLKNIK